MKRKQLIKNAMILVWIGELWNVFEAVIALSAGTQSGSIALLAFGSKSIIELFLGGILIWQLRKEWKMSHGQKVGETKALKYLGWAFFVLAAYASAQSVATLLGWLREPETSLTGIFLVIASAVLMTVLYFGKTRIAKKIGSRSLQKEAVATLACDLQDMTVFVGLGFNALFGWWWADPVSALLLVPFLVKEGREALEESKKRG
ncbi:MAG: cation transporter [Candidatus Gottesmanbacteria bacterium]